MERIRLMFDSERQALCIVFLVALSLVLPVFAGSRAAKARPVSRRWMRTVWGGQLLMGLAAIAVLAAPVHAYAAVLYAAIVCTVCALKLHRQLPVGLYSSNAP